MRGQLTDEGITLLIYILHNSTAMTLGDLKTMVNIFEKLLEYLTARHVIFIKFAKAIICVVNHIIQLAIIISLHLPR